MKFSILAFLAFTSFSAVKAQNPVPSVVFRGNCANNIPSYQEWFQQSPLLHGEAYIAAGKRQEQFKEQYSKLKLQMSLVEVQKILGNPDFSKPLPAAHLATAPEPSVPECSNQIAYIFKKSSENMADTEDVAVFLFFSVDDKLYWASPQNLPELKPLGSPTEGNPRQNHVVSWKEYIFTDDGFAITLPEAPSKHSDPTLPEMTVYTVSVIPDSQLRLQVSHQNRDCAATLAQLRNGALQGKSGTDPSSVKKVSIDGHPGLEYQSRSSTVRSHSDRFYCVNGKFYWFSSDWPSAEPQPAGVGRIVSSFRLLDTSPHK